MYSVRADYISYSSDYIVLVNSNSNSTLLNHVFLEILSLWIDNFDHIVVIGVEVIVAILSTEAAEYTVVDISTLNLISDECERYEIDTILCITIQLIETLVSNIVNKVCVLNYNFLSLSWSRNSIPQLNGILNSIETNSYSVDTSGITFLINSTLERSDLNSFLAVDDSRVVSIYSTLC